MSSHPEPAAREGGAPRLWSLRVLVAIIATGVAPPLIGMACGAVASPAGAGLIAAVGVVVAAVCAWLWLSDFKTNWVAPVADALRVVEEVRRGSDDGVAEVRGAPVVRAMLHSLNLANRVIRQRNQLSQANLMSVESAFERIHSVLHSLEEGILLVDADRRVLLANDAARVGMREDRRPLEGRSLQETVDPALFDPIASGIDRVSESDKDSHHVSGIEVGDRVFDLTVVPVRSSSSNKTFGTAVALVDVTHNHEVARLKDELISSISHELRTPLTNICAFTEILQGVSPDSSDEWREFVSIVATESQHLKELVDDVLEHSQLQTGEVPFQFEEVDVEQLVARVVGSFAAAAAEAGVQLSFVHADSPVMRADARYLEQALRRLIDNALKFTPPAGAVCVRLTDTDEAVELVVADSGEGVAVENREAVFERFAQMGDHMTDKPKGTGIGLAICRDVVHGHGGSITCDDADLGGAAFRIVLPR